MLKYINENSWLLVLLLSCLALLLALLKLWLSRKRKYLLERDKCGWWRYHKDTQFRKKDSYGKLLEIKYSETDQITTKKKETPKSIAVLAFKGDLRAKEHETLAHLVDEIEINADQIEEVVVSVTSPGGMVQQYGHAFAQMERLRELGLNLTVCVDTVAASGGYLMSIPAQKIIAAPFAAVGSIGVMAFVPNIRKFLLSRDIVPRTFTAGRFKRTVTLTDEATPEEVARFQEQLESVHRMFGAAVSKYRGQVKVDQVTTGEHWTAAESLEKGLGLIDELGTSHDYLLKRNRTNDLVFLSRRHGFWDEGLSLFAASVVEQIAWRLMIWSKGTFC